MTAIVYRGPKTNDIKFFTSTWLKSYCNSPAVRGVPNQSYYHYHHKVLETLLTRGTVVVAHLEGKEDQIVGYACAETFEGVLVFHYVYVKRIFRRMGMARRLCNYIAKSEKAPLVTYTHKTKDLFPIEKELNEKGWLFNPYLLWTSLPEGWEDLAE